MKIKQSDSDNALCSLCKHLDDAQFALTNCASQNHDMTSVVYVSSLLIMPNVMHKRTRLIDRIIDLAATVPESICLVRTTSPEYFRGNIKILQRAALNSLRSHCYVVVFSPRREFLNHAKFLIHYNFCLSEQVVHYGTFFGSTNLTGVGLGNPNMRGNFEEFAESVGVKYAYNTSNCDRGYLKEIRDLINYKAWIYTDFRYLKAHVLGHIKSIEKLLAQDMQSPYYKREAYKKYVLSMSLYNQTLGFLDDLPGRNLTSEILHSVTSKHPAADPFEVEAMSGNYSDDYIDSFDLDNPSFGKLGAISNNAIKEVLGMIKEKYEPRTQKIREHFDEIEMKFAEGLEEYHETRATKLGEIINPEEYE